MAATQRAGLMAGKSRRTCLNAGDLAALRVVKKLFSSPVGSTIYAVEVGAQVSTCYLYLNFPLHVNNGPFSDCRSPSLLLSGSFFYR